MPNLLNRFKHEEFESIVDQKSEGKKSRRGKENEACENFALGCEIAISCTLFKCPALFLFHAFDFLTPFFPIFAFHV